MSDPGGPAPAGCWSAGAIHVASESVDNPHLPTRSMVPHPPVEVGDGIREEAFPGVEPVLEERSLPVRSVGPGLGAGTHHVLTGLLGRACGCPWCEPAGGEDQEAP